MLRLTTEEHHAWLRHFAGAIVANAQNVIFANPAEQRLSGENEAL